MDKKHINDHLADWLTGNDHAFNVIIDHYYPRLMAACQQMLPNKQDAEELVMNVFLKIWQHKDQLFHVLKFDSYLFGILRQQIVRHARRGVFRTVNIEDQELNQLGTIAHPELDLQDLKVKYRAALAKLHPRQREVFVFSRDHDMSQQEIADKMGLSVYTVNNHITSALKVLRQELKECPGSLLVLMLTNAMLLPLFR